MLSRVFPKTHPRAGEETGFAPKILAAINGLPVFNKKIHTIRANYPLWQSRIAEVEHGEAVIKLRQWLGEPYRSKTVLLCTLTAADGIGLQKLTMKMTDRGIRQPLYIVDDRMVFTGGSLLAQNDGLSLADWSDWFKDYDWSQPLAIIHFTPFRYKPAFEL